MGRMVVRSRRAGLAMVVACVGLIAGGCSDDAPVRAVTTASSPSSVETTTTSSVPSSPDGSDSSVSTTVEALSSSSAASEAESQAESEAGAGCDQPYLPVYANFSNSSRRTSPQEVAPVLLSSLSYQPPPLDTDGDGLQDQQTDDYQDTGTLPIRRGDGDLVLTANNGVVGYALALGDLNSDGRSDFSVVARVGDLTNPAYTDVIVPGPAAPGTFSVFDVGISMAAPMFAATGVGDQDGDGFDDVAAGAVDPQSPDLATTIASGQDLLAPGPGGELSAMPPSIVPLEGFVIAVAALEPGPPTVVSADADGLTVFTRPGPVRLAIARERPVPIDNPPGINYVVTGHLTSDGHRIVEHDTSSRHGSTILMWDLDDPCRGPTFAAPADPSSSSSTS